MMDRAKVVKGLEICSDCGFCESIKKFDLRCPYRNNDGKGCDRSQLLMDALAMLKEQERKKGSWDYGTQCSVCKGTIVPPWKRDIRVNFCPWCGADMRGGYDA